MRCIVLMSGVLLSISLVCVAAGIAGPCYWCGTANANGIKACVMCGRNPDQLNQQAREMIQDGRYKDTVKLMKDYCKDNRRDFRANLLLIRAYLSENEFRKETGGSVRYAWNYQAFNVAQILHFIDPQSRDALYACAWSILMNERPAKAKKYLSKALRMEKGVLADADLRILMGDILAAYALKGLDSTTRKSRLQAARTEYMHVVKDTEADDAQRAMAWYKLGRLLANGRKTVEAKAALTRAEQLGPGHGLRLRIRNALKNL